MTIHDVVIVGSGPAGWTAALYTARAGLQPVMLAGTLNAGGALMTTTEVENFPGWPEGIMGPELMEKFEEQATRFGADMRYEDAIELRLAGDIKEIVTESETYQARTVILALGSEYKKLGVTGEERLSGHGVSYCATCDGFFFSGQEIAIVGGGDSAATEAEFLSRFGSTVHLIHRRDELRASQILVDRLMANEKIVIHWNTVVDEICGEDALESLVLRDTVTNQTSTLEVKGLFVAIGHEPRSALVANQLECNPAGYITVNEPTTLTSVPGVFACGDVVDFRYQQAVTAAGSGCKAALDAEMYLTENFSHK
ncbi:thioredoxin-disulfide reductase [Trueperella sp. LYQ143]|uniref:thioredoxin-disulfide reductase n=1 Tax=unclassified Trueperella TaxID=2630174 RepID=UPI0039839030